MRIADFVDFWKLQWAVVAIDVLLLPKVMIAQSKFAQNIKNAKNRIGAIDVSCLFANGGNSGGQNEEYNSE